MLHARANAARLWALASPGTDWRCHPGRYPPAENCPFDGPLRFERVLYKDRVLAFRAGREQRHGAADEFLDPAHVLDGLGRQVRPRASAGRRLPPSFDGLIHRLEPGLCPLARRKIVNFGTVQAIADAHLYLVESVENIQLGQGQAIDPAGPDG